jgi:hypothetical protein
LDEKCKKLEETNTIGYTRKQSNKEWFDEKCAKLNKKKIAARDRAIQIKTRGAKNDYKLARTKERRLFREKQGSSTKRLKSRLSDIGAVRDAYLALEREAAKEGLKINEQKTKYMIAAWNYKTIFDVAIGDKH